MKQIHFYILLMGFLRFSVISNWLISHQQIFSREMS